MGQPQASSLGNQCGKVTHLSESLRYQMLSGDISDGHPEAGGILRRMPSTGLAHSAGECPSWRLLTAKATLMPGAGGQTPGRPSGPLPLPFTSYGVPSP